jgi:hypothetical protein
VAASDAYLAHNVQPAMQFKLELASEIGLALIFAYRDDRVGGHESSPAGELVILDFVDCHEPGPSAML